MARARSVLSVNVFVMIDIATGLSMDPPMACSMRNAISQPRPGARLHSAEPTVKVAQADLEDPAAADPVGGRAGEHQQAGEHERVAVDGPLQARPPRRAGHARWLSSAMFTIVLSRPTMNRLDEQITSTSRRRRRLSSGSGITPAPTGPNAIASRQLTIAGGRYGAKARPLRFSRHRRYWLALTAYQFGQVGSLAAVAPAVHRVVQTRPSRGTM